jgi:hypothetical protein
LDRDKRKERSSTLLWYPSIYVSTHPATLCERNRSTNRYSSKTKKKRKKEDIAIEIRDRKERMFGCAYTLRKEKRYGAAEEKRRHTMK